MPSFVRLKACLTPAESAFYEFLWDHHLKHKAWPSTWHVYRTHLEKPKLARVLNGTRYTLYSANTSSYPNTFELQTIGILVTAKGGTYRQWLVDFFAYLRDRFYAGEDSQALVTQADAQRALKLSEHEADELGQLLRGGFFGIHSVWQPNSPEWQTSLPCHTLEDFPRHGSLKREFGTLLDRLLSQSKKPPRVRAPSLALQTMADFSQTAFGDDPDKSRRYQVFVSSPFDDLKEERQQVVQALLEMQCFPAGMELFPATSAEQWTLIKRVIDESDYYVVIVAARYGSLIPGTKICYTEREFDYARRIGKPIFAFYHGAPGEISGNKTERTLVGKTRLERFVAKLKNNRLCKSWNNAHELGSAVKSALQQAFKDTPCAGWTRAN